MAATSCNRMSMTRALVLPVLILWLLAEISPSCAHISAYEEFDVGVTITRPPLPRLKVPSVSLPKLSLPKIVIPPLPHFSVRKIPKLSLPWLSSHVTILGVSLPKLSLPPLKPLEIPGLHLPPLPTPKITIPSYSPGSGHSEQLQSFHLCLLSISPRSRSLLSLLLPLHFPR